MKPVVIFLSFSFINSILCCNGCVGLDDLTFDKVVTKFKSVLVKFDQFFPSGPTHEVFSTLATEINNKTISGYDHSEILIATVGIKDYGEFDNKALGEKYGRDEKIKFDSPVIKLFNDGDLENPIEFVIGKSNSLTVNQLYSFLKLNSRARVQIPGCILELDDFAEIFVRDVSKRQNILEDSEALIEKINCEEKKKLAKTYISIMKGVMQKGEDFVKLQGERMLKLLKDKLSEKKVIELNKKLNILASFKLRESTKEEL